LIFPLILSIEISSVTATIIGKIEDFFKKKAEPNQGWYGWDHVAEREVRRELVNLLAKREWVFLRVPIIQLELSKLHDII